MMAIIDDSLIYVRPIPNGFTYSLASRLGHMIAVAEQQFGPRDKSFTVLGVEFREGVPQSWFPGNCGHVVIQLGREAMQDTNRALFQLAHECVHLLDPHAGGTNKLEEGVAARFALNYMKSIGVVYRNGDQRYDDPCALVDTVLGISADAIKSLRQSDGPLRNIRVEQIRQAFPNLNQQVATELAAPF
jgi:hypothetical protein